MHSCLLTPFAAAHQEERWPSKARERSVMFSVRLLGGCFSSFWAATIPDFLWGKLFYQYFLSVFLEYYPNTHHWAPLKVPPFHLLAVVFSATVISFKNLFPKLRKWRIPINKEVSTLCFFSSCSFFFFSWLTADTSACVHIMPLNMKRSRKLLSLVLIVWKWFI